MMFKFCVCAFFCAFVLFSSSHVVCEDIATEDIEVDKKDDSHSDSKEEDVSKTVAEDLVVDSIKKEEPSAVGVDLHENETTIEQDAVKNADILDSSHDALKIDEHAKNEHTDSQDTNSSTNDDHLDEVDVSKKKNTENPDAGDLKVESREEGVLEIDSDDMVDDSNKSQANDVADSDEAAKEKIFKDIVAIGTNQTERKSFAMDDESKTSAEIVEGIPSGLTHHSSNAGDKKNSSTTVSSEELVAVNVEAEAPSYDKLVPICGWNRYSADSAVTLKQWIRWWKYLRMKQPVVMPWLNGLVLRIYPGNEVYRSLYVRGIYDPNFIVAVCSLLNKGGTFIDAGANIGHFSLLASGVVGHDGHVIAIEPSSRDYNRLIDNIKINGLENVISPYRFAISDVNGGVTKLSIACEERSSLNTIGSEFGVKGVDEIQVEDVSLVTLDSFVANTGISRIEVLKLDIEGSELKALNGAANTILRFRPAIMIGVNSTSLSACGATREEIQKFMQGIRYRMYRITYSPKLEFVLIDDISKNYSKVLFCFHESVIPPSLPQPENKSITDYVKDFFTK